MNKHMNEFNDPSLIFYLKQLDKKILSKEEENSLLIQCKQGNQEAKNILVEHNLRLVVKIANTKRNRGVALLDLIEEGNLGLIVAIDHYNLTKENRFATYASYWIYAYIIQAIDTYGKMIRLPKEKICVLNHYLRAQNELRKNLQKEPEVKEIANYLNMSFEELKSFLKNDYEICSLDDLYEKEEKEEEQNKFALAIEENLENQVIQNSLKEEVNKLLAILNDKEQEILRLRYGFYGKEETLKAMAIKYHVSEEYMRIFINHSLDQLIRLRRTNSLACYLDYPEKSLNLLKQKRKESYQ